MLSARWTRRPFVSFHVRSLTVKTRYSALPALEFDSVSRLFSLPNETATRYELVIGLEIHAQVKTRRKLFSRAFHVPNDSPNTHVAPYDIALPGTLPSLSMGCVSAAIKAAKGFHATVQLYFTFDRKHYFYPDLPAGYQVTQHAHPIAKGGHIVLNAFDLLPHALPPSPVRIVQIQLEQDTAKTLDDGPETCLIDYNRSGAGLLEIVMEPDLRTPWEAAASIKKIREILRATGASDAQMEEGSLRCDVNLSVNTHTAQSRQKSVRCEIKNINSIKAAQDAIFYELARLISAPPSASQTLTWDTELNQTRLLRTKDESFDYRYMHEHDLPCFEVPPETVEAVTIGDLPDTMRQRWFDKGLKIPMIRSMMERDGLPTFFEAVMGAPSPHAPSQARHWVKTANWITSELIGSMEVRGHTFERPPLRVQQVADLCDLIQSRQLTVKSGQTIMLTLLDQPSEKSIACLMSDLGLDASTSSEHNIVDIVQKIIKTASASDVALYQAGQKPRFRKWLVGQVMKATKGSVPPEVIEKCLDAQCPVSSA